WLDELGLERFDLVGHSFGGGVAQWLLLRFQHRIRRLALVAPGGLGKEVHAGLRLASLPNFVQRIGQPFMGVGTQLGMRALDGGFEREDIEMLSWMNAKPGSARAIARTVSDVIDWRGQRMHFFDRAHEIGELPPTALFWGDKDQVLPLKHAHETTSM